MASSPVSALIPGTHAPSGPRTKGASRAHFGCFAEVLGRLEHLRAPAAPGLLGGARLAVVGAAEASPPPERPLLPRGLQGSEADPGRDEERSGALQPFVLGPSISLPGPSPSLSAPVPTGAPLIDPFSVLRSIAWGGDRRRGAARLELAGAHHAGTTVLIESDGGALSLSLEAPPGVDVHALADRLRARLERKGLTLQALEIR